MHWVDLFLILLVSVAIAFLSVRLFSYFANGNINRLGIEYSRRRLIEFFLGLGVFSLLLAAPSLIGLLNGELKVETTIFHEFTDFQVFKLLLIAGIGLLINSFYEEITSRAVPLKFLERYNLVLGVLVSAVLFAAIHFVDEPFKLGRFLLLGHAGILLVLCYLLTGNIWFASGVHTATNWAESWNAGVWHLGSLIKTRGTYPAVSEFFEIAYLASPLVLGILVWNHRRDRSINTHT